MDIKNNEARTVLEIGPQQTPLVKWLKDFQGDERVIYIERDKEWMEFLKRNLTRRNGNLINETILQADASKIPLKRNSVDIVFLKDVFGQEGLKRFTPSGSSEDIVHVGNISEIASELIDVIKPGGRIVIAEMATPVDIYEFVDKIKKAKGSESVTITGYGKDEWNQIFDPSFAKVFAENSHDDAYVLVLEKAKQ